MATRFNYRAAALRICVDTAENGRVSGRIYSQRLRAPMAFTDVGNLLVQVDTLLDVQKFPQAFQRIRTFTSAPPPGVPAALSPEEMLSPETVDAAQGERATFLIHITTRQSATWQGFVDWLDGSPKQTFSSALELMKFMDERLFPR